MPRLPALSLLLLLALLASAQEEEKQDPDAKQIAWVGDWEEAFKQAKLLQLRLSQEFIQ